MLGAEDTGRNGGGVAPPLLGSAWRSAGLQGPGLLAPPGAWSGAGHGCDVPGGFCLAPALGDPCALCPGSEPLVTRSQPLVPSRKLGPEVGADGWGKDGAGSGTSLSPVTTLPE